MSHMILYDYALSGNGWKVRTLLRRLEVPFRIRWVDLLKGEQCEPWFRALNPVGQIPVLVDGEGCCWTESTAILQTYAQETELLPHGHEGHQVRAWMCFEQTWIDGVISRARFRRAFPHVVPTAPEFYRVWDEDGRRALSILERHLGERTFLVGERFTVADIAVFSYVHLAEEAQHRLEDYPAVARWIQRVGSEPGVLPLRDNPEAQFDQG